MQILIHAFRKIGQGISAIGSPRIQKTAACWRGNIILFLLFKCCTPISSIEGVVGNLARNFHPESEEARRKDAQQVGEMTCGFESRICYLYVSVRIKTIHGNFLLSGRDAIRIRRCPEGRRN